MNTKQAVVYVCKKIYGTYGIKQDPENWRQAKHNTAKVCFKTFFRSFIDRAKINETAFFLLWAK